MATTLADINKTLIEQNKTLEDTSEGINSLVGKISAQMEATEKNNLKQLEVTREKKKARIVNRPSSVSEGFLRGSGISGLAEMLSNIIPSGLGGMLAGAVGLAFGKLFKGAVVGGIIATFFGDEIMAWVRKTFDKDNDGKIFEGMPFELNLDNPATIAALTLATGVIANGLIAFVAKNMFKLGGKGIAKLLTGVGGLILGGLGLAPDAPPVAPTTNPHAPMPKTTPNAGTRPNPRGGPAAASRTVSPKAYQKAAQQIAKGKALPTGITRNAAGALVEEGTKKFKSVDDVTKALALQNAARYAKYAKALKFLGVVGAIGGAAIDPAIAIYSGASDDEIKKQIAGAIGSIGVGTAGAIIGGAVGGTAGTLVPGVGTAIVGGFGALTGGVIGAIMGEAGAEKLAEAILTGKTPSEIKQHNENQAMSMPTQAGNYSPAMLATARSAGPTQTLEELQAEGRKTVMTGTAPAAQVKVAPAPKLSPSTVSMMQMDTSLASDMAAIKEYLSRTASGQGQSTDMSTTTVNNTSQTTNSYLLDMGQTVDLKDAGLAFGGGPR